MSNDRNLSALAAVAYPLYNDLLYVVRQGSPNLPKRITYSALMNNAISVKSYGAVGDDATDDTAAFNAALAAADAIDAAVYVPTGVYSVTAVSGAAIDLFAGSYLYGDGPNSVIHMSVAGIAIQNENDTTIRDLTIRGSATGATYIAGDTGVQSYYSGTYGGVTRPYTESQWHGLRSKMYNLVVEDFGGNALQICGNGAAETGGSEICNCILRNLGNEGILAFGDGINIHDNYISDVKGWGIDVSGSRIHITNNELRTVGDNAIHAGDTGGIILNGNFQAGGLFGTVISGNTIDGSTNNGITVLQSGTYALVGTVISRNTVNNVCSAALSEAAAIQVFDDGGANSNTGTLIDGNTIYNSGARGIQVRATTGTTISNNKVNTTGSRGIDAKEHAGTKIFNVVITGNTVKNVPYTSSSIVVIGAERVVVANNLITDPTGALSAPYAGIAIDTATFNYVIASNVVKLSTTNGYGIHLSGTCKWGEVNSNSISTCAFAIFYDSTGDYANIVGNNLSNGNTAALSRGGTNTNVYQKDNHGYNPRGSLAYVGGDPAVPATTVGYQNTFGYDCMVVIIGGTVTVIDTGSASNYTATGIIAGTVIVPAGGFIKLTYSVVPTWKWYGL